MAQIVFVFDRVMHYHRELFRRLDTELFVRGHELVVLSGRERESTTGRVALRSKVVRNQSDFRLTEKSIGGFMLRYQSGVAKEIARMRPAVVVTMCHSGTLSEWQIVRQKRNLHFRLIAWQCGYEFNPGPLKRWVLGSFIPHFDHHLAYHTNAMHYALAHGARPDQVTVMHNTINEAAIVCMPKDEARKLVAERWPAVAGKKIVLYVGAVLEEKRLELVFDALNILKRQDVVFLLVGDGPHVKEIKRNYGQRKDFVSTGQIVDGVGPYFDAADVFVLPGTGGLAINEAMAHGLAVVSGYADGSADDLVIDGKNGYRLKEGSAEEMAGRLSDVLADDAVAFSMGEAGRQMIRGELSFERFIRRVVDVLAGDDN